MKYLRENFEGKYSFPNQAPNTFVYGYEPKIDSSEPIDPEMTLTFSLILE